MPTQTQIDANRPCTDAGLKFGIDAKSIVLPCEDAAEFDEFRQKLRDLHQPFTVTQFAYVDIIAVALWKHRRYQRAEQQEFAVEHLRQKECDWYKPAFPLSYPSLAGKTFVILRRAAEAEVRTANRALDQLRRLKHDEIQVPEEAEPGLPEPEAAAEAPAPPPKSPERSQSAAPEPRYPSSSVSIPASHPIRLVPSEASPTQRKLPQPTPTADTTQKGISGTGAAVVP